ncbi:tetratricopeptide repeat protein [Flavobacterium sp.]|uniref:tetratricopeptide repeat protein n=1 Tax=Flavobacterium sp. TaxID=239 RepID=UPI0035B4AB19
MKKIILLLILTYCFTSYSQTNTFEKLKNEAFELLINKEYNKALIKINEAIKLNSNNADAFYCRGNINEAKNLLSSALSDYLKATKINPKHKDATSKCAIIYGKQKDMPNFCKYSKKACELGSDDACNMNNRFCN